MSFLSMMSNIFIYAFSVGFSHTCKYKAFFSDFDNAFMCNINEQIFFITNICFSM